MLGNCGNGKTFTAIIPLPSSEDKDPQLMSPHMLEDVTFHFSYRPPQGAREAFKNYY